MLDALRLALVRRLETLASRINADPALPIETGKIDALRTQGNDLLEQGKLDEAENCFRQALTLKQDDTRLLVCLGYSSKEQGRLTEARIVPSIPPSRLQRCLRRTIC